MEFGQEQTGAYYEDFPVLGIEEEEEEEQQQEMEEYVETPVTLGTSSFISPRQEGGQMQIYTHAAESSSSEEEEEEAELAEEELRRQAGGMSAIELLRERSVARQAATGASDIRNVGEEKVDTSLLTDSILRQRGLDRETARRLAAEQTLVGPGVRSGQILGVKLMPNFSCRAAGHCKVRATAHALESHTCPPRVT